MDETNTSRAIDATAAATRKRRSSILKSQRPPRTPFSELEFNVATPTDTVKSRRVSFSKRTGVAEFVTNEATTTWKNFYEEQNGSMESSGNVSEMHHQHRVVSLGKKIFDEQFEEVEAIDLISTLNCRSDLNINNSMQNVNFAPLEMTAASFDKLTAPKNKFELSTFTEHQSKVFKDDLALSNIEVTEVMDINFSNVQPLADGDDLDEIERDIGRVQTNIICHGPFNMGNMSGYIEVDMNTTNVVMRKDDSEMSITNSIHIPKVDDLSKSISLDKKEINKDWFVDKENIAINPYVTPRETDNFAINEESDKILVFDGKKLTIQSDKEDIKSNRHTMLPNPITYIDQRKTITLNVNDDLPNFFDISEASSSEDKPHVPTKIVQNNMSFIYDTKLRTVLYDDGMDISMTQALPTNIAVSDITLEEKQRTIVFGKDTGNISITQVVPNSKIVSDNDANISLTEALPSNILLNNEKGENMATVQNNMCKSEVSTSRVKDDRQDKRRTILYESNNDISITQALPGSILPPNLKGERRQTIVFDNDTNMSITQAIPYQILLQEQIEKRKSLSSKSHNNNPKSEMVNNLPDSTRNIRRQTILSDEDGNMSMTQMISNEILTKEQAERRKRVVHDGHVHSTSINSSSKSETVNNLPDYTTNNRRQTTLPDEDGNMSMTQVIPNKILLQEQVEKRKSLASSSKSDATYLPHLDKNNRRDTMLSDDDGNRSITRAISSKILLQEQIQKRKSLIHDNSYSKSIHGTRNLDNSLLDFTENNRRQALLSEGHENMSITQAFSTKIMSQDYIEKRNNTIYDNGQHNCESNCTQNEKRQTIVFDNNVGDISITQVLPTNILNAEIVVTNRDKSITRRNVYEDNTHKISMTESLPSKDILGDNHIVNQSNICASMAHPVIIKMENREKSENQEDIFNQQENNLLLTSVTPFDILSDDKSDNALIQERGFKCNTDNENAIKDISATQSEYRNKFNDNVNKLGINIEEKDEIFEGVHEKNIANFSKPDQEVLKSNQRISTNLESDISMAKTQIKLNTVRNLPKRDIEYSCEVQDVSINKSLRKHINLNNYSVDDCSRVSVKPIPVEFSKIQDKEVKNKENKVDFIVMDSLHQSIMVYQSLTTSASELKLKRTEYGDVNCQRTLNQTNVKLDSSTSIVKDNVSPDADIVKDLISETMISTTTLNKESTDIEMVNKPVSVLDELLDMSTASMEGGLDDKYCTAKVDTSHASMEPMKKSDNASNESMFYITQNNNEEAQINMPSNEFKGNDILKSETLHLPLEYKEQPLVLDVQNKLDNLKSALCDDKNSPPQNRHYEIVVSSNINDENEKLKERLSIASKSFKTADDTGDLLRLLSDLTDRKDHEHIEEEKEQQKSLVIKGHITNENKGELEPKRLSFASKRQSTVISREDLLSNISLAQATLQKSRYELDLSDSIEDTQAESPEEPVHKKSIRISSEVVKALHFDDTASESSIRSELKMSPLKKTTFADISDIKETKANVIPSYLKDVSDNIKSLMIDLVKPIQDVTPFEMDKSNKGLKSNSTCSTQVQANLITSSQIDLASDINSDHPSPRQTNSSNILIQGIGNLGNEAIEHALKSALKSSRPVEKYSDTDVGSVDDSFNELSVGRQTAAQRMPNKVLIFDHYNPLNNVLLAPPDSMEVHNYNPKKSTESICLSERNDSAQISVHDTDKEYRVERLEVKTSHVVKQGGDMCIEKSADIQSVGSNISKSKSIDESVDVKPIDMKDIEVNTMIAMKGTKQLLEGSSSLTLVDDTLTHPAFNIDLDTNSSSQDDASSKNLHSPLKTILKKNFEGSSSKDESDLTSTEEGTESVKVRRKKRHIAFSPANAEKHRHVSKMQKVSQSPINRKNNAVYYIQNYMDENLVKEPTLKEHTSKFKEDKKTSSKGSMNEKPGISVTVQQLLTEYDMQVDEPKVFESESTTASKSDGGRSMDMISSFTSSKNFKEFSHSGSNIVSTVSKSSKNFNIGCQTESRDDCMKNPIRECDSVNVVAKIDVLPFMGSPDCEWESCNGDTWSFRLLHSRLRLLVGLAHRHGNAARTRVSADTPVLSVEVHESPQDERNPVAVACVAFAAEAMRHYADACVTAGDVPALLVKCGAVARLALRWGRAMHDARLRLAYTLDGDGVLVLKVANIPLRSIWEVTMRLELTKEAPWPRAVDVRVSRVVSDYKITEEEVKRALSHVPQDWGQVPRTVWRIFKYLKHKKPTDELLGI